MLSVRNIAVKLNTWRPLLSCVRNASSFVFQPEDASSVGLQGGNKLHNNYDGTLYAVTLYSFIWTL